MKKLMIIFMILYMISFVIAQTDWNIYYRLSLDYDTGEINISSVQIEISDIPENTPGDYRAKVMDYNDNLLNLTFFDVPNKILWDGINPETGEIDRGGELELNQTSFEIFIPYYENAKEIIIYNKNQAEIARRDISEYSKQRAAIQEKEANETERQKAKGNVNQIEEKITKYWWILLIILIILVIILIYSLRKKGNK